MPDSQRQQDNQPQYPSASEGVSVIVPCRNEADFIEAFLDSVLAQDYDGDIEILIADGMSDDGSRDKLKRYADINPHIRLIDNPRQIVPTGLNAAIAVASHDIIIRLDVHTEYAKDYIQQCVKTLYETNADNVGGAWRAEGRNAMQQAIALAFQSPYSSGAAASHNLNYEGAVDSVYLGCWRKQAFERFGLFDDELVRNQDDELNLRINRGGGVVYQSPRIHSRYYPRDSLLALFRQYMQYGYWKVRVIQKHRIPASPRHLIPGAFVLCLLALTLLSPFVKAAAYLLVVQVLLYIAALVFASISIAAANKAYDKLLLLPVVLAMFHLGYGYGFLRGVMDFILLKKGHAEDLAKLTRK